MLNLTPMIREHSALDPALQAELEPFIPFTGPATYNADAIEQILSFRTFRKDFHLWWQACRRLGVIFNFFLQIIWMSWWDRQIWSYLGERNLDLAQTLRRHAHGRKITETLLVLGPTFIKVGQSLSTRVDLLRKEYIDELAQLQDRVPMFALTEVYRIIEEELGGKPEDIFKTFDPTPIAAASLGQVHRVTLQTGELAVIKVQRPNLVKLFEIDLCVLKYVARLLQRSTDFGRGREWVQIVDEFGRTLFEEVDYIREGRHADQFRRNFVSLTHIVIPKIFWRYTSRRVITMEYKPGTKLNHIDEIENAGFSRKDLSIYLVKAYFQQLLLDGFFHADPHPGNLVIDASGNIVLYDFGMVGYITEDTRLKIVNTFLNIVGKRTDAILKNLVELNMVTSGADLEEIRTIVDWALENYYDVPHDQLNFEALADEMAEVMYYYPFKLPASFTFMFRALITLEGVSTTLYPQIQFMGIAVEYAQDFVQKTYLVDRLLNVDNAGSYRKLIRDGLSVLGLPSGKERPITQQRVRLYYEEWKPLARYVKAAFLLLAFGQLMTMAMVFFMSVGGFHAVEFNMRYALVMVIVLGGLFYALLTFVTLFCLPSRKKPFSFNPPKRLVRQATDLKQPVH